MTTELLKLGQIKDRRPGLMQPLLCPGCNGDYVRGDLDEKHVTDDYTCPLGTRGSWESLRFECELCDAAWRLVVGFHKGQTFIGYVVDDRSAGA